MRNISQKQRTVSSKICVCNKHKQKVHKAVNYEKKKGNDR